MTLVEPVPAAATPVFGLRLAAAEQYADFLCTAGVERGLIGPREPERLWTRHLLNCAAPAELFPEDARVVDLGSGAGLPGLVLALARPDLRVDLVEPLARRVQFLTEAVSLLGLEEQVRVVRGRAEERQVISTVGRSAWVTARAVAPLDRLVGWCLPLLSLGGRLVAMKGSQAESELVEHRQTVGKLGGINPRVVQCGVGVVEPPVTVVVIERGPAARRVEGK